MEYLGLLQSIEVAYLKHLSFSGELEIKQIPVDKQKEILVKIQQILGEDN